MTGAVVRQYRLPSGIARGVTYDRKRNKDVGWFKSLSKQVTEFLGKTIVEAYTPWIAMWCRPRRGFVRRSKRWPHDLALAFAPKDAAE